jgi:hypothetical protein
MSGEVAMFEVVTEANRLRLMHVGCGGEATWLVALLPKATVFDLVGLAALHDTSVHAREEIEQRHEMTAFPVRIEGGRIVLGHNGCAGTASCPHGGPAPLAELVELAARHITRGHAGVW